MHARLVSEKAWEGQGPEPAPEGAPAVPAGHGVGLAEFAAGACGPGCRPAGAGAGDALNALRMLLGLAQAAPSTLPMLPVHAKAVAAGMTLVHEGQQVSVLYVVRRGSFKQSRMQDDGYEQVLGFPARGDLIGFTGLADDRQPTTVVALEDAEVITLSPATLYELEQRLPGFARAMHRALARALDERSSLADLMAAVASEVRLARFVVQMGQRALARGESAQRLRLAMTRRDVASYLGLAHETVSRAFGTLAEAGYLRVCRRHVEVLDVDGLRAFASATRRRAAVVTPPPAGARVRRVLGGKLAAAPRASGPRRLGGLHTAAS